MELSLCPFELNRCNAERLVCAESLCIESGHVYAASWNGHSTPYRKQDILCLYYEKVSK
jgi:hypothetical protein